MIIVHTCGSCNTDGKHSLIEIGHEIMFTAILSLPLISVGQFSVTDERIDSKYLFPDRVKSAQEDK